MGPRAAIVLWLGACRSDGADGGDTGAERLTGAVIGLRRADGAAETDVRATLAGARVASPDASGFLYYLDLPPGRTPLSLRLDGHAVGHLAPDVRLDALSGGSIDLASVDGQAFAGAIDGPGIHIDVPDGAIEVDGAPVSGAWTAGAVILDPDQRWATPGDLQALTDDVVVEPIDALLVAAARGWQGDADVAVAADQSVTVTITVGVGSPLLADDLFAYLYSGVRAYWIRNGRPTIDAASGTISFPAGGLGWWAIGRPAADAGCVAGTVLDEDGAPLVGAQVALARDGGVAADRRTTDEDGFCLPLSGSADVRVIGSAADRSALYTWSGRATGSATGSCDDRATCAALGAITPDRWPDEDGDRSFTGPAGDCDDADPAVNPSYAAGDGSYCGGALW